MGYWGFAYSEGVRREIGYLKNGMQASAGSSGIRQDDSSTIFPSPLKLKEEKNWVPLVIGEDLYFAYSVDPLVLFKFTGEGLIYGSKKPSSHENIRLRGGTQFVHWKDGLYLGIAHQQRIKTHKFHYLHEFAVFDSKQMKMIETSEPFFLHKRGIEFAAGIMRCGNSMVISYGVSDAACYVNR